jgi:hypothetical protein
VFFGNSQPDPGLAEKVRIRLATIRGVGMSAPWVYLSSLGVVVNLQTMVAYPNARRDNDKTHVMFVSSLGETKLKNADIRWY